MQKNIISILAVVFIVGALVLIVLQLRGGAPPPTAIRGTAAEVIDVETGELVTKFGVLDWDEFPIDKATGYKRGPDGKLYSDARTCYNCGKKIANMPKPDGDYVEAARNYKCPHCKQPAIPPMEYDPNLR